MDVLQRTIMDDLDAGDGLLSLKEARKDRRLMVDGRAHDLPWIHRAATKGLRGVTGQRTVLETIVQSGRKVTTSSAILRFVHRQANGPDIRIHRPPTEAQKKALRKEMSAAGW